LSAPHADNAVGIGEAEEAVRYDRGWSDDLFLGSNTSILLYATFMPSAYGLEFVVCESLRRDGNLRFSMQK